MIDGLKNRMATPGALTDRQREAADLVSSYYAGAHELPSTGWLSRRMGVSQERARHLMLTLREKADPTTKRRRR